MKIEAFTPEFQKWIANADTSNLIALTSKARKELTPQGAMYALNHLAARHKAAKKVPDLIAATAEFIFPSSLLAEQCTPSPVATFNANCCGDIHGKKVADITFGLGVDAIAFANAGAMVQAVDINPETVIIGQHNISALGVGVELECMDSLQWLRSKADNGEHFDILFADPARRRNGGARAYAFIDCSPLLSDVLSVAPKIANIMLVKASPMLDVHALMESNDNITELYAVALHGECKELLIKFDFQHPGKDRKVTSVDIDNDGTILQLSVEWPRDYSKRKQVIFATPAIGLWLYIPSAAIRKASTEQQLIQLWPELNPTQGFRPIFLSTKKIEGFPGRRLFIDHIYPSIKEASRAVKGIAANTISIGYPISAEGLAKKLKLQPLHDDSRFIIAYGSSQNMIFDCHSR